MLPYCKLYYKFLLIETVLYWHKNRHIDQWNTTEPRNNLCIYSQLSYNKGDNSVQLGKDSVLNKWY